MVAYKRVFETVFDWETKRLFTKWSLTGGGRLREVVARRELTVSRSLEQATSCSKAIHWISCYPVDKICRKNSISPEALAAMDSDLSSEQSYLVFEQLGSVQQRKSL